MLLLGKECAWRVPNLVTRFKDAELGILYEGLDTGSCPTAVCFGEGRRKEQPMLIGLTSTFLSSLNWAINLASATSSPKSSVKSSLPHLVASSDALIA